MCLAYSPGQSQPLLASLDQRFGVKTTQNDSKLIKQSREFYLLASMFRSHSMSVSGETKAVARSGLELPMVVS